MTQDLRTLGLIAARGGSKGLPRKNVLPLGGRPLIAWSISAALGAATLGRVILSSDDDEIIEIAREWECEVPFRRPTALAGDTVKMEDVALHALDSLDEDFDVLVLLQPTSPFRTSGDIDSAVRMKLEQNCPSVASVTESAKSPYWMFFVDCADGGMAPVMEGEMRTRRQELPPVYFLNGAVYVVDVAWFRKTRKFVTQETRAFVMPSSRSIDIDAENDLRVARALVGAGDPVST